MANQSLLSIFLFTLMLVYVVSSQICRTPDNQNGNCIFLRDCPHLLQLLRRDPLTETNRNYLLHSQCDVGLHLNPKVCCNDREQKLPSSPPTVLPVPPIPSRIDEENKACRTPNNRNGQCVQLQLCPSLYAMIQKVPLTNDDRTFLRQSQCGYNGGPKVCCSTSSSSTNQVPLSQSSLLPTECGVDAADRIYGGQITKIDEYPWMALLEYSKPNNRKGFHCGGVLISDQYVLTAAHCLAGKDLKDLGWRLTSVRLGEWDVKSTVDCELDDCSDAPIDVPIEELISHESYNPSDKTQENDIAIIRLTRKVAFTDWVKPICLPTNQQLRNVDYTDIRLTVAGWGKTENGSSSNYKLKVGVNGVSLDQCNQKYSRHNVNLGSTQLCAGGELGYDSCRGDSGGPLMLIDTTTNPSRPSWYAAGIVSFGPTPCGMAGWPGVYTRVGSFVDWIISNMRE